MTALPQPVKAFLESRRIVVAGVSRQGNQPANLIFRRLRDSGHEVVPTNPKAETVEGARCYPSVSAVPGPIDALMVVTRPGDALAVVREAADRSVRHVWFHRSFGAGSVSDEAVAACRACGIEPIVGGCPMMFADPVDVGHRCMRWFLQHRGRVPR